MKSILFQLAYQAASTILSLFYLNKYPMEKRQHDHQRKQQDLRDVSVREENDRRRISLQD